MIHPRKWLSLSTGHASILQSLRSRQFTNRHMSAAIFFLLAIAAGGVAGILVTMIGNPVIVLLLLIGAGAAAMTVLVPEVGVLTLIFMIYLNLSDILIKFHGAPSTLKPFIALVILTILIRWRFYGERPKNWQLATLLIAGYGITQLPSLLYAEDFDLAKKALSTYFKDAIIAIIIATLIQRGDTLRRAIWVLVAGGIFLGSISTFQQLTGTVEENYWGFGQAIVGHIANDDNEHRISGPIGDPNFYGQILVMIVPLALDRVWNERKLLLRLLAGWSLSVTTLSILFTFSRGAFLSLVIALLAMFARRPPSPLALLITVMLAFPLMSFVPAGYSERLLTLVDAIPFMGGDVRNEGSFKGRTSEKQSAIMMFQDHPLLGVGINNYQVQYQRYSRKLGLDSRRVARDAHSLYLQIAAETGLLGLVSFGAILLVMLHGMWKAEHNLKYAGLENESSMVAALSAGTIGYLVAAIFLHAAYPRYFWMLYGISLSTIHVARYELAKQREAMRQA